MNPWNGSERDGYAALAAVVIVGTVLRFAALGAESIWIDEAITLALIRRHGPLELVVVLLHKQPHFPTYYVLLDLWAGLVGPGTAALRALSAAFGVATLGLVYPLGARLFDRPTGLVATALVALARFQIRYAQEIRMYAALTTAAVASFYCLLRRDERRFRAGYVVASVCTAYLHPFGGLAVLAGLGYLGYARSRWAPDGSEEWPGVAGDRLAPLLVVLSLVPIVVAGTVEFAGGVTLTFLDPPGLTDVALTLLRFFGEWHTETFGAAVGVLVAVAAIVAVRRRHGHDGATTLLVLWASVPIAVLFVVSHLVTPVFWYRYVAVAAPAWYLLVARGITAFDRRALRVGVAALLVVGLVPSVVTYHTTDSKEQWDEAVADIEERADRNALVLVDNCMTTLAYREYATREDLDVVGVIGPESGMGPPRTPTERVRELVDERQEVWVVFSHVVDRERRRVRGIVDAGHEPTWNRSFVGIEVTRYGNASKPAGTGIDERTDCRKYLL